MNYRHIKLKLRVFLRGCSVAMVTYCIGEKTLNFSVVNGNVYDTTIKATNENLWLY